MPDPRLDSAYAALDAADDAVRELHEGCCQPLRSPRMETLAGTLRVARDRLEALADADSATAVRDALEDAGAQLGFLQVACCAPDRTPLYTETLDNLAKIQRVVSRIYRLEH
ncbi:MAG: hypothetical protein J5I28_08370 [Acidimicrobiales bacterium]|nr:hypothetical protein [Acidimicrobiales bacterium]